MTSSRNKPLYRVYEYYKPFLRKKIVTRQWITDNLEEANKMMDAWQLWNHIHRHRWIRYSYDLIKEDGSGTQTRVREENP